MVWFREHIKFTRYSQAYGRQAIFKPNLPRNYPRGTNHAEQRTVPTYYLNISKTRASTDHINRLYMATLTLLSLHLDLLQLFEFKDIDSTTAKVGIKGT